MNESEFHRLADITLAALSDALEDADQNGTLDVEYQAGVMTIENAQGKSWVVSKHGPTKQIWLSSPISGGLHFSSADEEWKLADGRTLTGILSQELGVAF